MLSSHSYWNCSGSSIILWIPLSQKFPHKIGVLISEVDLYTRAYTFGTSETVLIREASFQRCPCSTVTSNYTLQYVRTCVSVHVCTHMYCICMVCTHVRMYVRVYVCHMLDLCTYNSLPLMLRIDHFICRHMPTH